MEAPVSVGFSSAVPSGRNVYRKPSAPMNSSSPFMGVTQAMSLLKELDLKLVHWAINISSLRDFDALTLRRRLNQRLL